MNTDSDHCQKNAQTFIESSNDAHISLIILHRAYDCPLYLWSATGYVKVEKNRVKERHFLYIEYRARNRASKYIIREFVEWLDLKYFVEHQADSLLISDISPKMTRLFVIKSA